MTDPVASGVAPPSTHQPEVARLADGTARAGIHLASVTMRPSARGRRYRNSAGAVSVMDGPFTESKELVAGYVIVSATSLDDASRWAQQYIGAVAADEVDLRELE